MDFPECGKHHREKFGVVGGPSGNCMEIGWELDGTYFAEYRL